MSIKRQSNKQLVFLYDDLMCPSTLNRLKIPAEFMSFAYIEGKFQWVFDKKKRRQMHIVAQNFDRYCASHVVFGAIYLIDDIANYTNTLCAYYNSSSSYTGMTNEEDLYVPIYINSTPIKFKSLSAFEVKDYKEFDKIEVLVMTGNHNNKKVIKNFTGKRHTNYRIPSGVHYPSFLKLFVERSDIIGRQGKK